jgi:hypothetical protein
MIAVIQTKSAPSAREPAPAPSYQESVIVHNMNRDFIASHSNLQTTRLFCTARKLAYILFE